MLSYHKKLSIGMIFLSVSLILFFTAVNYLPLAAGSGPDAVIRLEPSFGINMVGETHTVTATVIHGAAVVVPNVAVTFTIVEGPNIGRTHIATTNSQGEAQFSWTSSAAGEDKVNATATSPFTQKTICALSLARKVWILKLAIPEFWLGPALGLTGFFAALGVFQLFRRRERSAHIPAAGS